MKKLLVVIDYQNDFVNGALGFAGAEALEGPIIAACEETLQEGGCLLFTRDTHEEDYLSTREGKSLPVPHCIAGTAGHQLFGRLHRYETEKLPRTLVIDKPTFGAAALCPAAFELCGGDPDVITLAGVVTDICVIANAILLHTGFPKADIRINSSLVGSGNRENAEKTLDILRGMGFAVL